MRKKDKDDNPFPPQQFKKSLSKLEDFANGPHK